MKENSQIIKILLQSNNNAVIITDKNGTILEFNNCVKSLFDCQFEITTGIDINKIFNEYNKTNNSNIYFDFKNLAANNSTEYIEKSLIQHNENNLTVRIYTTFNKNSLIENYIFIFINDISTKGYLYSNDSEMLYKKSLEYASDIIYITDENGNFLLVNPATEKITGYSKSELSKMNYIDIIPDNKKRKFQIIFMRQLLSKERSVYIETPIITKNGETAWLGQNINLILQDNEPPRFHAISRDITSRRNAQLEVKRNQEMLRLIIDMIPDRIYLKDSDGKFLINNRSHLNALGAKTQSEAIGKTDFDYRTFANAKKYRDQDIEILKSNKPLIDFFEREISNTGEERLILISKFPFHISGEPSSGIVGVSKDITELNKYETQNVLLANAIKSINECVTITDLEDKLIFVNKAFCKTYEYTEEEVLGKNIAIVSSTVSDVNILQKIKLATYNGGWQGELINKTKSGRTFPIFLSTTPIFNKNNIPFAMIGVARDVTIQKNHESEILKLNQAIIQSSISIILTDPNGTIEYANPKALEITGYLEEELLGQNPRIFKSGFTPLETYKELWNTITSGKEWHGELLNKKKSGELYWEYASISSIKDKNNQVVQFIAFKDDITKIKDLQISLKIARDKAEIANELKDNFIATISHEIRTPINGILGMTSLIKEAFSEHITEEESEYFDSLNRSSKRITRTTDLIINYSRYKSQNAEINKTQINLIECLQNIINNFSQVIANKQLEVSLIFTNNLFLINSDEFCINEIFTNLIDNAIKFTNQGKVDLKVFQINNEQICVEIIDTGIGISNEYLPDLFEPYIQEENGYTRSYDGIGLGLALTKLLIDKIGASIKVKSKKGEGTTIAVLLNNT